MCKISIIVPIYNIESHLKKCISSLLQQTIVDQIEIILINDGSTDNSLEICQEYEKQFNCIRVINKPNGGVSSARNEGLKVARGEYVAFVDGDDYVDRWYYEELYNAALNDFADLVVFDYFLEFENGSKKAYRNSGKHKVWHNKEAMREFLSGGIIGVNLFDKLFRKSLLNNLFFDENIKIGEDLYYIFKCLKKAEVVTFYNKPGYHYFQRANSAMNEKFQQKYFDVITVSKRIIDEIKEFDEELMPYARALYIHSAYKTLERAYKFDADENFSEDLKELEEEIKLFSIKEAKKNLSFKQFAGFLLMRTSIKLYLFVCRIMKI